MADVGDGNTTKTDMIRWYGRRMPISTSVETLKSVFLAWIERNRDRFAVAVQVDEILPDRVTFSFVGHPPELSGWCGHRSSYSGSELLVEATWCDIWDGLCWLDECQPMPHSGGWVCATCLREGHAKHFASPVKVWEDHLFDPFLKWVNETLAPADRLGFYDDIGSGVMLLKPGEGEKMPLKHVIRLPSWPPIRR